MFLFLQSLARKQVIIIRKGDGFCRTQFQFQQQPIVHRFRHLMPMNDRRQKKLASCADWQTQTPGSSLSTTLDER